MRMNRNLWKAGSLALTASLLLIACADKGSNDYKDIQPVRTSPQNLRVTTYNVGLVDGAFNPPHSSERQPQILEAIKQHEADVVCLQEVWSDANVANFKTALKDKFPYQYSVRTPQVIESPKCSLEDTAELAACGRNSCSGIPTADLTACILSKCAAPVGTLTQKNPGCFQAVAAQAGQDLETALSNALQATGKYANDGSHGVMLISKYPLQNQDKLIFESTNIHRAVIYAEIIFNQKSHQFFCGHLTANLGASIPYTGPYGSWEKEGLDQSEKLIEFASKKLRPGVAQYIAGDFNCSIANPLSGVIGDFAANCQKFLDAGYQDAAHANFQGCTFCSTNKLTIEDGEAIYEGKPYDVLLDHIFTKNTVDQSRIQAEVVFRDIINITLGNGQTRETNLSDHYGVRLTVPVE